MAEGAAGVQRGPVAGVDAVVIGRYPTAQRCGPVTWKEEGYRYQSEGRKGRFDHRVGYFWALTITLESSNTSCLWRLGALASYIGNLGGRRHDQDHPMECAYVHGQLCATSIDDPVGVEHRHQVRIDNLMWSSDSPHTASTWPQPQEVIARDFKDVPAAEQWQMV